MSNWHPEALAAAMGSLTITGTSHTTQGATSIFIFQDEANNWQAVNIKLAPVGFEGGAAKNFDGIEPHDLAVAEMRETTQAFVNAARGAEMTNAISALHTQKRSDGRPAPFIP